MLVVSILSLAFRGLEFGIDFTGGTLVEVGYPRAVELEPVRATLQGAGFEGAVVQHFGTAQDVLIRIAPRDDVERSELSNRALDALRARDSAVELRRVEFVGPQVGEELTEQGGLAMLIALGAIFLYVMFRFEWKFSAGAVAALFHDVTITLGIFSVLGLDFDLTVLAAILAVIGYSLNDTIVVFDRIRENFRRMRRGTSESIINRSLNQTLSRTLMTSLTTLLVLVRALLPRRRADPRVRHRPHHRGGHRHVFVDLRGQHLHPLARGAEGGSDAGAEGGRRGARRPAVKDVGSRADGSRSRIGRFRYNRPMCRGIRADVPGGGVPGRTNRLGSDVRSAPASNLTSRLRR